MGLKIFPFYILPFLCHWCHAQKQASIWHFAYYAGIDFGSGAPVPLNNSAMWIDGTGASICDGDGNLLFYTDGNTVWNKNNIPMPNGNLLNLAPKVSPLGLTTANLIVPQPNNDSILYIFTASPNDSVYMLSGFFYSVVNMNKENGLGDVAKKSHLLFKNTDATVSAVHHANGKDVWLVAHEWGNNSFRSYLITENGIDTTGVVISQVGIVQSNWNVMKLSPDGKHLALAIQSRGVQVFDFDNDTGIVSNPIPLLQEEVPQCSGIEYNGVEFSPNGNLLYYTVEVYSNGTCSSSYPSYIKQYNIQRKSTPVNVGAVRSGDPYEAMQLALDGKIYVVNFGHSTLGSIQKPNEENDIDFVSDAVYLPPRTNNIVGLCNFIQSYFLFPDPVVEMPNVFTPNGDIFNERFIPKHFENIGNASLVIVKVNRWGEQVFQTNDPQEGWDGGNFTDGVYYWFISYYGKNGKQGSQRVGCS